MTQGQLTRTFRPPFFVPHSLDELQGPAHGFVDIPHSIMWAQQSHFVIDLDHDDSIRTAYLEILGRASSRDMKSLVNKDHLIRLWPVTRDRTIVPAWQTQFPELQVRPHVAR